MENYQKRFLERGVSFCCFHGSEIAIEARGRGWIGRWEGDAYVLDPPGFIRPTSEEIHQAYVEGLDLRPS